MALVCAGLERVVIANLGYWVFFHGMGMGERGRGLEWLGWI